MCATPLLGSFVHKSLVKDLHITCVAAGNNLNPKHTFIVNFFQCKIDAELF